MNSIALIFATTLYFAPADAQTMPGCPVVDSCASAKIPDALGDYAVSMQKSANSKYAKAAGHPNDTKLWLAAIADFREAARAIQKDVECLVKTQASTTCPRDVRQEVLPESAPGAMVLDGFAHKDFSEFIRRYRNAFSTQNKLRECLAEALIKNKCAVDSKGPGLEATTSTTDI